MLMSVRRIAVLLSLIDLGHRRSPVVDPLSAVVRSLIILGRRRNLVVDPTVQRRSHIH